MKDEKVVWQAQIEEMKNDYDNLVRQYEGLKKDSIEFQVSCVFQLDSERDMHVDELA